MGMQTVRLAVVFFWSPYSLSIPMNPTF